MKKRNKLIAIASTLLFISCSVEPLQEAAPDGGGSDRAALSAKICNTANDAVEGTLIVKFNESAIPVIEKTAEEFVATRSGEDTPVTRSGIENVDKILDELQITMLKRVFPKSFNEGMQRRAGLHRWYKVGFAEGYDLNKAAAKLASVAEISTVQFNKRKYKTFTGGATAFTSAATKSIVTADFNDPQLVWQWHYINNADQAISTTARAGADINVADAWKLTGGDKRIIVAVVDEGVKYTHPDLAANMWTNPHPTEEYENQDIHGWNFAEDAPVSWDKQESIPGLKDGDTGHGTHVAGTVAAVNNNGTGVCGVAGGTGNGDGVRIMSCQIFSGNKTANDEPIGKAIVYAANHGAHILQCSYGASMTYGSDREYEKASPCEIEAIRYFLTFDHSDEEWLAGGYNPADYPISQGGKRQGNIAIFAAGNEGKPYSNYPGSHRECISVTAIGPDGLPGAYTCYNLGCNIAAPGGETTGHSGGEKAGVLSTLVSEVNSSDYGYMQGTSMACPHVSGVAALGLSYALKKGKTFSREEFTSMLLTSVNDIDSRFEGSKTTTTTINLEDYKGKMGTGLVDAYQLLMQIEGTPCLRVPLGTLELITLDKYFGGSAQNLTYTGITMENPDDMDKLGMTAAPEMYNGQLMIKCTKPGVMRITVKAIAGGVRPGSETVIGGIEVEKTFAIIARDGGAANGGWL